MANNRKAAGKSRSKSRRSNNEKTQNTKSLVNSEDSAVIISECSRTDEGTGTFSSQTNKEGVNDSYLSESNSTDLASSSSITTRSQLDQRSNLSERSYLKKGDHQSSSQNTKEPTPLTRNLRIKVNKNVQMITKKTASSRKNTNTNRKNIKDNTNFVNLEASSSLYNEPFKSQTKENFTLQDLFKIMADDEEENDTFHHGYTVNGKDYIKIEPTSSNQGDEIVIKLPSLRHRRAVIDLTTSKQVADMMFSPVLVDEKERFKRLRGSSSSSTEDISPTMTTTTTPVNVPEIFFPQLTKLSHGSHQGQYAFIQPNFTVYPPNARNQTKRGQAHQNQECAVPAFKTPYAMPCVFIPTATSLQMACETPITKSKKKPKSIEKKCALTKKGNGKSNFGTLNNGTQSLPVRVTSSDGYDNTHYVDLPLEARCKTVLLDPSLSLDQEPKEPNKSNSPKEDKGSNYGNSNSQPAKKRGRPAEKKQNNNKKNFIEKYPTKKPTIVKLSVENLKSKSSVNLRPSQKENIVTNNASYIAGRDMPSINDETAINQMYESQSCNIVISADHQSSSVVTATENADLNVQTPTTTTFFSNCYTQQTNPICNISKNIGTSHTLMPFGTSENYVVSNESNDLLERFYMGEVGEIFYNTIDSSANLSNHNEQQNIPLHKKTDNSAPEMPIISSKEEVNNAFLFLNNIQFNNIQKDAMVSGNSTKSCVLKTETQFKNNSNNVPNAPPTTSSQFFYTNHSFGDDLFEENVENIIQTNVFNNTKYETSTKKPQQNLSTQHDKIPFHFINRTASYESQNGESSVILSTYNDKMPNPQSRINDETCSNSNVYLSDHSYSMHMNDLSDRGEKLMKDQITKKSETIQSHEKYVNDNCPWTQSEHTQSPLTGLSELDMTCQVTYENALHAKSKFLSSKSNAEKYSVNQIKKLSQSGNPDVVTKPPSPLTGKLTWSTPCLLESDLFLPPLELESKLENDILDFDCESLKSTKFSTKSNLNDETESLSDRNQENSKIEHEKVVCFAGLESKTERLKSWLQDDKNTRNDINLSCIFGNSSLNNDNQTFSSDKNQSKTQKPCRKSENLSSRLALENNLYRKSVDAIPSFLYQSDMQNFAGPKDKTDSREVIEKNQHVLQTQEFNANTEKIVDTLKKNFIVGTENSTKLKQTSTRNFPEQKRNQNESKGNYAQNQDQPLSMRNKDQELKQDYFESSYSSHGGCYEPLDNVINIAKFFHVNCIPSLFDNCHLSNILRDTAEVGQNLRNLSKDEVNTLYKFVYRHKVLFFNYFNEFCYYYAENNNVNSLCRMLIDCQRYKSFPANKFTIVYNSLLSCGIGKVNACKIILKYIERRTVDIINTIISIIVDCDWTLFVNNVREIISDSNVVLHYKTIEKMAKSLKKNPDNALCLVFLQSFCHLNAFELQELQRDPNIQNVFKLVLSKLMTVRPKNTGLTGGIRRNSVLF